MYSYRCLKYADKKQILSTNHQMYTLHLHKPIPFFHLYHETNINNHTDRYMYVCVYFEVNLNKHRSILLGVTMWETEWASWWLVTGVPCTVDRSRCPMALDDSWCVWHLIYANHINCLLSIVNVQRCSMTTGDLKVRLERISRSKKSTFRIENRAKNQKNVFEVKKWKYHLLWFERQHRKCQ